MKAGEYYVGDLCYVFSHDRDNWDLVCERICGEVGDGEFDQTFPAKDGSGEVTIRFASYGTAYGDGCYEGIYGTYPVDAGIIGCIALEDLEKIEDIDRDEMNRLGKVMTFEKDFATYTEVNENGPSGFGRNRPSIIVIGNERIDTDPPYEDEDEWEDEEEYDGRYMSEDEDDLHR